MKKTQRKRGYDDKGQLSSGLPLDLRPTREDYSTVIEIHKDVSYQAFPEEYKEKNNIYQAGLVERSTSTFKEELYEEQQKLDSKILRDKEEEAKLNCKLPSHLIELIPKDESPCEFCPNSVKEDCNYLKFYGPLRS